MKVLSILALLSATVVPAFGHYRWTSLIVNGAKTGEFKYVRPFAGYNTPITNLASNDVRCNVGGASSSAGTATVSAGSTIGFGLDQSIFHNGVINVYMAKAPGNAASFDGSGNVWFKVAQLGAVTNGGSITFPADNISQFTFKIPSSLPSGQYVARIEHIALHSASGFQGAQFYISCANLNVTGGGKGNPGPKVAFPGYYTGNEPGIKINIYYPVPTKYVQPGPAVWSG